jgi:hypothetical protein
MILVRNIFQAQFGRAGDVARSMKEGATKLGEVYGGKVRVLTDLSGQFDTVVLEIEIESLAKWERTRLEVFARPEFREEFARTAGLITGGRSEIFTIE